VQLHKLQPSNGLACVVPPIRTMYLRTSPALEACSRAGVVGTLARWHVAARYSQQHAVWTPQEKRPLQKFTGAGRASRRITTGQALACG